MLRPLRDPNEPVSPMLELTAGITRFKGPTVAEKKTRFSGLKREGKNRCVTKSRVAEKKTRFSGLKQQGLAC